MLVLPNMDSVFVSRLEADKLWKQSRLSDPENKELLKKASLGIPVTMPYHVNFNSALMSSVAIGSLQFMSALKFPPRNRPSGVFATDGRLSERLSHEGR